MRNALRFSVIAPPVAGFVALALSFTACAGEVTDPSGKTTPERVFAVALTPPPATLAEGSEIQLQASVTVDGAPDPSRSVTWQTTDATIATVSGTGLMRAVRAGDAAVVASVESASARASFTVVPPDAPRVIRFANEPAGMTRITDWSFPTLTGSGWTYQPEAAFAHIVQDATTPTDSSVAEFVFPAGFVGGGAPGRVAAPRFTTGARELYWAFTFKANASWQGHSSTINKIGFGWQNDATLFGLTWYWSGGTASPSISLFDQGSNLTYFRSNTAEAVPVQAGAWHEVEVYYRPSSATGRADAIVKVWVNGVLMNNHINVVTTAGTLNDVYFEPTWGGVGDTKAATDYFRFGQARISVR